MPIRALLLILLAASALTGCGRRGALEAPPAPDVSAIAGQTDPAAAAAEGEPAPVPGSGALEQPYSPGAGTLLDQESPGSQEPAEAAPANTPKRRFFLDPLI
jgi:predicted small lipoprotein YifL